NAKAAKFFDGQKCGDNAATPGIPPGRATDLVTEVVNVGCRIVCVVVQALALVPNPRPRNQAGIVSPAPYLRNVASNTMGTLTKIAGAQVMTAELQTLVDQVVKNTDPNARAGCAVALGSVLSAAGGMASSAHLRTIVQILHSLSSDPHPVVHMWALHALSATVYGAGLMFSPFVNLTVDLIAKLFLSETHEPGGGASANIQAGMGLSEVYQSFGRIISGIIGTLGPELQHQCQVRDVCLNIAEELKYESEQFVVVEALRCTQSFIMFPPAAINVNVLVPFLQRQLGSRHNQIKRASVTCLYQLVQRDPAAVLMAVPQGLEEQLFAMLDTDPYVDEVKSVITGLLRRTAVIAPSRSIDLCRKVLTKASATEMTATAEVAQSGIGFRSRGAPGAYSDEDRDDFDGAPGKVAGVPAAGGQPPAAGSAANPPRWRTQIFALNCLRELIRVIRDEPNPFPEHFDFGLARSRRRAGASTDYLVLRLPDLIKMAFTAATNQVIHMRLEGLQLLKTVIVAFGGLRDPDFEEVSLMEQYHVRRACVGVIVRLTN
ncbi:MAG: armadillo-type protein, partial [Olpidium bornovanus]